MTEQKSNTEDISPQDYLQREGRHPQVKTQEQLTKWHEEHYSSILKIASKYGVIIALKAVRMPGGEGVVLQVTPPEQTPHNVDLFWEELRSFRFQTINKRT
jgi:hypothetical protein